MPGLVAVIGSKSDAHLIDSMANSIAHEKWHRTDLFSTPSLAVGRVHLGIVNPEKQPIFNEDKSICIVMDGEVFDYEDERKKLELSGHEFKIGNDPEFCLHLFEEYGEEFVEKLNGAFVLVLYDSRQEKVIIANDRLGLRPFYHFSDGDSHIFSSEVKAILKDPTFKKEIDHEAVADFFAFGRILGNKTLFKRVSLLPPGSIVVWSKGGISQRKYWDFKFEENKNLNSDETDTVKTLATTFKKAVEQRTRGKHRYGVFLSGGLDSRLAVGAIDKKHYPISTFTFGLRGGDEEKIAKKVAEKLGTEHQFIELQQDYLVSFAEKGVYLTDGMLNCAHFYWISFLQTVRTKADVMFHGLGLDILLTTVLSHFSYGHFFASGSGLLLEQQISKTNRKGFDDSLYKLLNTVITEEMMPLFFSDDYYIKIRRYPRQSFKAHLNSVKGNDPVNKVDSFWLLFFGRYFLSRVILRNYCEDRLPSMDNAFFECALGVPRRLRFNSQRLYFKLLAQIAFPLATIPYQRTGVAPEMPAVAHKIGFLIKGSYKFFVRKLRKTTHGMIALPDKIGYPDLGELIRRNKNLRAYFEKILLDEKTLGRGYFNRSYITQMVKDHMSDKKDFSIQLCALLTFELWHRMFVDPS